MSCHTWGQATRLVLTVLPLPFSRWEHGRCADRGCRCEEPGVMLQAESRARLAVPSAEEPWHTTVTGHSAAGRKIRVWKVTANSLGDTFWLTL